MGGNIPSTQKIFSKYKFVLPYQNEPDSRTIACGVTESRSVGRSDGVPTAAAVYISDAIPFISVGTPCSYCTAAVQSELCEIHLSFPDCKSMKSSL